ncbi:MAG TPA: hypothetical protein VJS67_14620 [Pseudonocardiaceae bacterium]|nr:hypothetical protein [Pseudonocardiaceae bacterium]
MSDRLARDLRLQVIDLPDNVGKKRALVEAFRTAISPDAVQQAHYRHPLLAPRHLSGGTVRACGPSPTACKTLVASGSATGR